MNPKELKIISERDLERLPDGARVTDDQGFEWERAGDWWRLDHSHMVLRSWELWACSRYLCQLVPYSPDDALKEGPPRRIGASQENRGLPGE